MALANGAAVYHSLGNAFTEIIREVERFGGAYTATKEVCNIALAYRAGSDDTTLGI